SSSPFVLELHVPIHLPQGLLPSLPAPPYNPSTISADTFRDFHALPLLRRLLAFIAKDMLGASPEAATATAAVLAAPSRPSGPDVTAPAPAGSWLVVGLDGSVIGDKENDLDIEMGW
ncbi:hypothetical protein C8A05DRAFT_15968, partial [Staphylotrichum tortipilum]